MRSEVRLFPDPPLSRRELCLGAFAAGYAIDTIGVIVHGAVAQLGEHLLCKQGVTGSIPVSSTSFRKAGSIPFPLEPAGRPAEIGEERGLTLFFFAFFNNLE